VAHSIGVRRAAEEVWPKLRAGKMTALDACEQVVRVLETDPTFDAGCGAFLNGISVLLLRFRLSVVRIPLTLFAFVPPTTPSPL
jgi:Asparaginase